MNSKRFFTLKVWIPNRTGNPEVMPRKPLMIFKRVFYGSLKAITGFPFGDSRHNPFFSPDTSGSGIHSKKFVVMWFDIVEKQE
ncbi:MAG: hypothetical protein WCK78_01325 [Paludibacter sp.]|jgi:hypothetical protein